MFEGMDTSHNYGGGFVATQSNFDQKRSHGRGAFRSPWVPVYTKDIHDMLPGQDQIRRGTHESSEVVLVGLLRSAERKASSIEYLLDDESGPPLVVNQMIEDERQGIKIPVAEKTYVRVIGKIRTWGNQRGLTSFSVKPLKSLNEITMHKLEVQQCKLFYSKDIPRRREDLAQNKAMRGGAAAGPMYGMSTGGAPAYGMPAGGAPAYPPSLRNLPMPPAAISSGLTGMNGEIHKFLSSASVEMGYSVADIQKRFPQLGLPRIREHLELLASEGHVYTTVDDEHFRTTDS